MPAHTILFYDNDAVLLDTMGESIGAALRRGDAAIVFATGPHRAGLEERLQAAGLDVAAAQASGQFVARDAAETLACFMVKGMPEPGRFAEVMGGILAHAGAGGRRIYIVGEMVALLAVAGNHAATVRLEELWNEVQQTRPFALCCVYPMARLGGESCAELVGNVCAEHDQVIPAESYTALATQDERLRAVAVLQQKAQRLEAALAAERAARETAEAALRLHERDAGYRQIVDTATEGIGVGDAKGGITFVNARMAEMFGCTPDEMIGHSIDEFMDEEGRAIAAANRERRRQGITDEMDFRFVRKDGSDLWVLISTRPLFDATGAYTGARSILTDITARKAAEEARAQLAAIVEASEDAIIGMTLQGIITNWNPGAERLYSYGAAEVIGHSISLLAPPERHDEVSHLSNAVARGERIAQITTEHLRKDGSRVAVALSLAPVLNRAGVVVSAAIVARDISARHVAEQALRASEERFRALLAHAPVGAAVANEHGVFEFVNDTYATFYGYAPDEMIGQPITMVLEPERRAALATAYAAWVADGVSVDGEYAVVTRSGEQRTVLGQSVQYTGPDGRPHRATFSIDITERSRLEAALRTSEARFRRIVETAEEGIWTIDAANRITFVNARMATMLGYTVEEMLDRPLFDFMDADGTRISAATIVRRRQGVAEGHEATLQHRDGSAVWTAMASSPITDDTGAYAGALTMVSDITARKRAEQALRASEERLRQVEKHAPTGLALVAVDGRWLRVNPALCALVGYTEQELLACTFGDITHPDDLETDLEYVRQLLAGEIATYQMEKRYIRKDGATIWILLSVSLVRDTEGRPEYFISQIQDIEALKRTSQALEVANRELGRSNAELAQFASVASHDLRSPLNTIGSFAQLLSMRYTGKLDTDADEFLAFIMDAVKRMQQLISDMLSYAHLGAQLAPAESIDCAVLVSQVIAHLGAAIAESGAVVTHHGLPVVLGRASQLGQVFQNLIANAIKFHSQVPPLVSVSARRDGSDWLFCVEDNGIGIDPAHAERIFVLFQRLHTREEYPGTGTGLAVCKKIIEGHGGRIWVESHIGHGTRVLFTLPVALAS